MEKLTGEKALLISQDNYYKDLSNLTFEERDFGGVASFIKKIANLF